MEINKLNDLSKITKVAFFGTSLSEHLEAYIPEIYDQLNLPKVNSSVVVNGWRKRGFVAMLENRLITFKPYLNVEVHNFGKGGANSFDIISEIQKNISQRQEFEIAFLECGTNDIFRRFQNRLEKAVDIDTYKDNYRKAIELLKSKSNKVICISMPPVSPNFEYNMNPEILKYNSEAEIIAKDYGCKFIDVFSKMYRLNQNMIKELSVNLWSDESHLNELGDTMVANIVWDNLEL